MHQRRTPPTGVTAVNADTFIEALRAVEQQGDVEPMAALFADDAELRNPSDLHAHRGPDGAREFWRAYRATFEHVESSFRRIVADERGAALEWTSQGRAAGGTDFTYEGVTLLEWEGDRLGRFRAYFDPSDLTGAVSGG